MRLFLTLCAGLVFSSLSWGMGSADYVSIGKIKPLNLKTNGSGELLLPVSVKKGFHIQSNPAAARNLIATEVKIDAKDGIEAGSPVYPELQKYRVMGMDQDITVYSGNVVIKVPIKLAASVKPGKLAVSGTMQCQACDDKTCYLPAKIPVSASIVVK